MVLSKSIYVRGAHIYICVFTLAIYPNALPCYLTISKCPRTAICNSQALALQLHPFLQPLPQAFLPVFPGFWSPGIRQPGRTHSVQFPHHCSSGQGPTALTHQDQTQWNALSGSLLSQAGVSFPPNVKTRFQMIQNKQLAVIRYFPHTTEKIHTPYLYHQESRNISTQTAHRSSERLFPFLPVTREFL